MAMKRKERRGGLCPVCVEKKALTVDHVPPKGVFLKPRPTNTITVWTCSQCNEGTKLDDEYFRVYIAARAEPGSHLYRLWKEKVVESTFQRSPALRAELAAGMDMMKEHHKREPLQTFDGRTLTDEEAARALPLLRERIERVVRKIVRCLHAYHEGEPLPRSASLTISVEPLTEAEIEVLIRDRTGMVGGQEGEFVYRHSHGTRPGVWDWTLFFYLTHEFRVHVDPT
jgi:hypothetical protein